MRHIPPDAPPLPPRAAAEALHGLIVSVGRRRSLRDPLAELTEEHGFTPPQIHAMGWLGLNGAMSVGQLAKLLGVTEKTFTGVVDRLEGSGMVERIRDAENRRVVHVQLTGTGRTEFERMHARVLSHLERLMKALDAQARGRLLRIFQNLNDRMTSGKDAP
ncbi:MAG: MarR family transcriptional regulator [Deltaproteobacteria bacterium]|nr:MarR family transcriptional regulator [Deltaproteobacteria bacterium]